MAKPVLADVQEYLTVSGQAGSWDVSELTRALAAEDAAQSRMCRRPLVDADWGDDLSEALLRRVARNLAMRKAPLGLTQSSGELEATRISGVDPEIRRLEGPHRKAGRVG